MLGHKTVTVCKVIKDIALEISTKGGQALFVGGYVRDKYYGVPSKDIDVEVHGVGLEDLILILRKYGKVDLFGKSFGIIKLWADGEEFDFSLPRKEAQMPGGKHTDFDVKLSEHLTITEAAARRDFTINSMAEDVLTGELYDPYEGEYDITMRRLRHTSPQFAEDPLRVLRGMQFCARFDILTVYPETVELCQSMLQGYDSISKERIWLEWEKWALKGAIPSLGLKFLNVTSWILQYPALANLDMCPQDPEWHPEGDAWDHTLHVVDEAAAIADVDALDNHDRLVLIFAALLHDVGKFGTTHLNKKQRWVSPGHANHGLKPAEEFLRSINAPEKIIKPVLILVKEHMVHIGLPLTKNVVRRLSHRLEGVGMEQWGRIVEADHSGRPPLEKGRPAQPYIDLAKELSVDKKGPEPLIKGRHLLDLGWKPGPGVGAMCKKAYEAQLDGKFEDLDGFIVLLEEGF